jgi:hypothetical protein
MTLATVTEQLWRRRALVVVSAALAILVGLAFSYRFVLPPGLASRDREVGIATATALVDTPSSQIVDLSERTAVSAAVLPARATVLARVIANPPLQEEIARRAGIPPAALVTAAPAPDGTPQAVRDVPDGAAAAAHPSDVSTLRTSVPTLQTGQLPVIVVETRAPDARRAARLADQAIAVLQRHLRSVADTERVPAINRLVVRPLGAAQATSSRQGPSSLTAAALALVTFALACVAIVLVGLLRGGLPRKAGIESPPTDAPVVLRREETLERLAMESWRAPPPAAAQKGGDLPADRRSTVGRD